MFRLADSRGPAVALNIISIPTKTEEDTIKCYSYQKGTFIDFIAIHEGEVFSMERELPACPVETTLLMISDKWKVLILRDLLDGTKRFSELRRSVGSVSQKVLTANLRQMERDGLVHREVFPEVPPRVEYSLTETGQTLQPVIEAMKNWGTQYKAAHAA